MEVLGVDVIRNPEDIKPRIGASCASSGAALRGTGPTGWIAT